MYPLATSTPPSCLPAFLLSCLSFNQDSIKKKTKKKKQKKRGRNDTEASETIPSLNPPPSTDQKIEYNKIITTHTFFLYIRSLCNPPSKPLPPSTHSRYPPPSTKSAGKSSITITITK
jgi:hypothetical protein